jgi:hypothetical protein
MIDPYFGTRITRVSDRLEMDVDLNRDEKFRSLRNVYSKKQAWNSNGSLLLLHMTFPAPLLDGYNYEFLRMVALPGDATWSNTRPDQVFGVRRGTGAFVSYDLATGTTTWKRASRATGGSPWATAREPLRRRPVGRPARDDRRGQARHDSVRPLHPA